MAAFEKSNTNYFSLVTCRAFQIPCKMADRVLEIAREARSALAEESSAEEFVAEMNRSFRRQVSGNASELIIPELQIIFETKAKGILLSMTNRDDFRDFSAIK